ncbi:unnamed protein product [Leptidea sinapis]|uniref:Peptidoglycan recognition protein n=1 Tax=Leptidea sinapis TaxID=189913 RepID=A0A5E4QMV6_9NEOP|nr:unnamed protein product [Leptidea sinapis]
MDSECGEVPLAWWGSDRPPNNPVPLEKPVYYVIIQHTVSPECYTDEECVHLLRKIREVHIIKRKFNDIGNSFYVASNGNIYEGAGWNVGRHTRGYNNKSIGISFIGDFRDKLPTDAALKSAQEFIMCHVDNRNIFGDYKLLGHYQVSNTTSPGHLLKELIQTWPNFSKTVE